MESGDQKRQTRGIYPPSRRALARKKSVLKEAGIVNYSIWLDGEEVFGYYECEKGAAYAARIQAESPVVERWNEFMKDVMDMTMDEKTGAQPLLEEVFYLE